MIGSAEDQMRPDTPDEEMHKLEVLAVGIFVFVSFLLLSLTF